MDNVFSVEVKNAQHTLRQVRDGQRVSHRDIADAYGYLLVANMSNALGEEDMVTARVVFHELWRMKMMEEALDTDFKSK